MNEYSGFFSDLESPSDPIKEYSGFFSDLEPAEEQKPKKSFFEDLGRAFSYQMQSGGPSGAPSLSPEQAKHVATQAGTQIAVGELFAPFKILASASKYAPGFLRSLVNITQAGATGAAVPAAESLLETGELPSKEELLKQGSLWAGIDAAIQLTTAGAQFGTVLRTLKQESGLPYKEVIKRLWQGAKNYYGWKNPKVNPKTRASIIEPEKIEAMTKLAEEKPEVIQGEVVKPKEEPQQKTVQPKTPKVFYPLSKDQQSHLESIKNKHPADWTPEEQRLMELENDSLDPSWDSKTRLEAQKELKQKLNEIVPKAKKSKEQMKLFGVAEEPPVSSMEMPVKQPSENQLETSTQPLKITQPRTQERQPKAPIIGQKQAAKRSEIIKIFQKAFTDPIRLGKISRRGAAGIHKMWPKITRLLRANDVETAAHEIGHNLHTTLYGGNAQNPRQQSDNIDRALRPYLNELKPLAMYAPWGKEGFAEFTRMYVTNPDVAKKLAPKFYQKFEADLEAQYPELKNALLEAREYYDTYLQGTPESRIRAQTSYGEDSSKLTNIMDWLKEAFNLDKLKTNFLDDVFPAKRLVAEAFGIPLSEVENLKDPRNLYRSLRVLKGAVGKADVFLMHETFDPVTLKRKGRGLRQIISKLKTPEEYKEFNDYLIARRVIEKAKQGIETGIGYGDAVLTEAKFSPKYKQLASLLDRYNDSLLVYAKESGLISEEQYQAIKKDNLMYVPFQRDMGKKGTEVSGTSGKLQARNPLKRMKGSTRDIIAPIESIIKNTYAIILNAEKNLSAKVLAELANMKNVGRFVEAVPTPTSIKAKISKKDAIGQMEKLLRQSGWFPAGASGILGKMEIKDLSLKLAEIMPDFFVRFGATTYPAGENIVTVFFNGKPKYYEASPEIYEMWNKGIAPYTADIITKILRVPARALRAGAILNPKFIAKNIVRDTWGGFLFTKYGKSIKDPTGFFLDTLYSPIAKLADASKKSKLYVEWMKAGGGMSTMQSLDRAHVIKKLQEVRDGLRPTQVVQWLRKVGEIAEEANRLAEFGRALEVEGQTRIGKEIAAFASRDLSIDFAKMGLLTKALNQIIPFWNATIQGGDKFIRTLGSDKDRNEFLARAIGFVLVPSLILAWLNQDDERVKEFYEEEKDFNFIAFIGDTALKIPVPFETGVLVHGLTQRMYNFFIKKDPHAFEGFMGSIVDATIPNFIPSLANPFIEVQANKNFFTGAPIIPKNKEDLIAKYQYKNNTSSLARLLGRAIAYMLGQDTRSKAASPAVIDHFINSWGAGLGRLIVSIADAGLEASGLSDKIPGPERTITEKLGLDAFTSRFPRASTRSIEKFYDYYADATARRKSIKYAEKESLETPEGLEAAYDRVDKIYDYPTLQRAYRAMQQSQKAINSIWNNPDIDEKTKRTMIDDLYLQQIRFAQDAIADIEAFRLARKD